MHAPPLPTSLGLPMQTQPDDRTCGPTCLQAVYAYHDDAVPLQQVIDEIPQLETGGTLAVQLGCHALARGYGAEIYTFNLQLFDPTWFREPRPDIAPKLRAQAEHKAHDAKLVHATEQYLQYLELGGRIQAQVLNASLVNRFLGAGRPVLTGLSSTFLYGTSREYGDDDEADDVRGLPTGHFVVLCGQDRAAQTVEVADPWPHLTGGPRHVWPFDRLACAILLGVLTYDANLLVLHPGQPSSKHPR